MNVTETVSTAETLGTITDVWVIVALIIPGFISFRIFTWLTSHDFNLGQFLITIYSLIWSIFVFLPVAYIYNLQSLDSIREKVSNPDVLLMMIGFALLFGFVPGIILKLTKRRFFVYGSAWDRFAEEYISNWVTVYTSDDKEYIGWIKRISRGKDEKREISLGEPMLVKRTLDKSELIDMGTELLFTEKNIKKILKMKTKSS